MLQRKILVWLMDQEVILSFSEDQRVIRELSTLGVPWRTKVVADALGREDCKGSDRVILSKALSSLKKRGLVVKTPPIRRTTHVKLTTLGRDAALRFLGTAKTPRQLEDEERKHFFEDMAKAMAQGLEIDEFVSQYKRHSRLRKYGGTGSEIFEFIKQYKLQTYGEEFDPYNASEPLDSDSWRHTTEAVKAWGVYLQQRTPFLKQSDSEAG